MQHAVLAFAALAVALSAQAPPGYYNSVNPSTPATLRSTLHAVIDDHTRFPYTAATTDTWDILERADQHPTITTQILDVYKNASYTKSGGGNTNYKDDVRRARELAPNGIKYLDVGTSGGVWGLERGYCLMIGGDAETVTRLDPIFSALAPGLGSIERTKERASRKHGQTLDPRAEQGYIHAGPVGAGHFVKMIHNGIEYGMMQAFAEGFDIMRNRASAKLPADERYDLNLADIAEVWRRGSVVTSWLLDLTASALAHDAHLEGFSGHVEDSGEGRWTIEAAIEEAVPADVLAASLFVRFRSRQDHTFAEKVLSAMRLGFGGHVEAPKK